MFFFVDIQSVLQLRQKYARTGVNFINLFAPWAKQFMPVPNFWEAFYWRKSLE